VTSTPPDVLAARPEDGTSLAGIAAAVSALPFRGVLPSLRFATGACLAVTGLAGVMGHNTRYAWLAAIREDWTPIAPASAYLFVALGSLLMLAWSPTARRLSWALLVCAGAAALTHGILRPEAALMGRLSALMLLVTGFRTFAATRFFGLAAALDGLITGLSLTSMIGYAADFEPLYRFGFCQGLSFLESAAFLALGILFMLADLEYARLNLRARRLSAAIAMSALAAAISFRVTEAVLDSLGHGGFSSVFAGEFTAQTLALGTTNLISSFAIGASALLLSMRHENALAVERERRRRREAEAEIANLSRRLDAIYRAYGRVSHGLAQELHGLGAGLRQRAGDIEERAGAPALEDALAARLAALGDAEAVAGAGLVPEDVDLAALVRQAAAARGAAGGSVLSEQVRGTVRADRFLLSLAVGHVLDAIQGDPARRAGVVSVRLIRTGTEDIVRFSIGGQAGGRAPDPGALLQAERVASWHGGRFWSAADGGVASYSMALPVAAGDTTARR
jgi:hypothetical protein